jgi:hypothetical protein
MTPPRPPEAILADLADSLLSVLLIYADTIEITIPRNWLAQWHTDVTRVLTMLRQRP